MSFPIYVPSKGRPNAAALQWLAEVPRRVAVVIQPSEYEAYRKLLSNRINMIMLPKNNIGIAATRKFIMDHAREYGNAWHWQVDDDIEGFKLNGEDMMPEEAFRKAEREVAWNVGMVGFTNPRYVKKSFNQPPAKNVAVCQCVLLRSEALVVNYAVDPLKNPSGMRTDADICLQFLSRGFNTVAIREITLKVPKDETNEGGLHEEYQSGRVNSAVEWLAAKWPKSVRMIKPERGRKRCIVDYKSAYVKKWGLE